MSLQIKPGYINPLSMKKEKVFNPLNNNQKESKQNNSSNDAQDIQIEKQSIQNEILLLQSSSDASVTNQETIENLKKKLEKISAELQTVQKSSNYQIDKISEKLDSSSKSMELDFSKRINFDTFEKERLDMNYPGVYSLERDSENKYKVSFLPYSNEQ